eukprot:scpid10816/ scgid5411/ CUB and sushi domain-containing protein 3; CUB and sushi multiple domains protein 3
MVYTRRCRDVDLQRAGPWLIVLAAVLCRAACAESETQAGDDCLTGNYTCPDNASCTNDNGTFLCVCDEGFTGNGTECEGSSECLTGTCPDNASCTNENGTFLCVCAEGFTGNGTECEVITCSTGPDDASVAVMGFLTVRYPETVQYACNPGYSYESGDLVRTCLDTGLLSGTSPICIAVQCEDVSGENLLVEGTDRSFMSRLRLGCRLGSVLNTNEITTEITCNASREWSPGIPECNIVNCTDLDDPDNGFLSDNVFSNGSVVEFGCNEGFNFSTPYNSLECQVLEQDPLEGVWSAREPECLIINCTFHTVSSLVLPLFDTTDGQLPYTSFINYTCVTGYEVSNPEDEYQQCQADGVWSGQPPVCEDINECVEGTHVCDPNANCNNAVGSFTCECHPCFKGSGVIGDCLFVSCSLENTTVPRSNFSLLISAESPLLFDSSSLNCSFLISYDCHTGYNITSGNLRRECLPDRTYSGLRPVCNFVNCTYPGPGWYATQISSNLTDPDETLNTTERDNFFFPRDMVGPDRFRYLSMATFECLEGYAHPRNLTNSSRLCLASGMLDGEIHHCFRRNCSILMPRNNSMLYKLNFTNPAYPLSEIQQLHDGFEEAYRTNFSYTNRFFFDCNQGYRLPQGESNVTECLANQSWSHPEPPCSPIPCSPLPTVYFADKISTQIGSLNGLFYDNEVQYTCDGGFTGSGTLKCTDPGYEHTVRPTEGTWIALEENPPWTPPDVTCHRRAQLLRIEPPPNMGETLLVAEDSTLQLACVHQGHPVATVRWFQDGVLRSEITSKQEQNEEQERRREVLDSWPSTITVPNVRRRNGGTWTCEISQARQEDGVEMFIERRSIVVEVRALQLYVINLDFDVEDPDENVTIVGTQQYMDVRGNVTDAVEKLFLTDVNLNEVFFLDSIPENPFHIRTGSIIVEMDLRILQTLVVREDNADELQSRFNMAAEDQADIFGVLVTPSARVMAVNITARLLERQTEILESAIPPDELADVANELYILTNANPGQLSNTDIGAIIPVVGALANSLADGNLDLPPESVDMIARDVFSVVDNTLQADATAAAADDAQETLRNAVSSAVSSLLTNRTIAGSVQGATVVGDSVSGANIINNDAATAITVSFSDDETPALAVGAGAMTGMASVQLTSDAFNAAACENRNETTNICMDDFSAVFTQFTDFDLFRDGNCNIGSSSILGVSVYGQHVTRSRNGETLVRVNFSVSVVGI